MQKQIHLAGVGFKRVTDFWVEMEFNPKTGPNSVHSLETFVFGKLDFTIKIASKWMQFFDFFPDSIFTLTKFYARRCSVGSDNSSQIDSTVMSSLGYALGHH